MRDVRLSSSTLGLEQLSVIDNHCHPLEAAPSLPDLDAWRSYFTECSDEHRRGSLAASTSYYQRLVRRLALHLDVGHEQALLEARNARSVEAFSGELFRDARISGVVFDTGLPKPEVSLPLDAFSSTTGAASVTLVRLETLFEQRIAEERSYEALLERLNIELSNLRSTGYLGMKSICGYRTGLDIQHWSVADARASFVEARREVDVSGTLRLGHKPLLDTLLHLAFAVAARQEMVVQFHVGYGDRDVDLRTASPLHLRAIMEDSTYDNMKIILLHSCWPYFREGSFLASIYPNVWLDLSFGVPFLSLGEMRTVARAVLGSAPFAKIMYSSDGSRIPEPFWMSAHDGRSILTTVLSEMIGDGDLDASTAHGVGADILAGNASRLYGIPVV